MFLIFDTETTGLPNNYNAPISNSDNWPRMVQIAWQLHDEKGQLVEVKSYIVKPEGFIIPFGSEKIHGISTERATNEGLDLNFVLEEFLNAVDQSKYLVGHNIEFDINIVGAELYRKQMALEIMDMASIDTKNESTEFCALPGGKGGKFKWPNLTELYTKLFNTGFDEAHNASADVVATARCFLELVRLGVINSKTLGLPPDFDTTFKQHNPHQVQPIEIEIESNFEKPVEDSIQEDLAHLSDEADSKTNTLIPFAHLHLHTQYSILDGAANISMLVSKAVEDGMQAVAITDHGNMFGVKEFHEACTSNNIKPILGCETYLVEDIEKKDKTNYHLILLAKNHKGYHNLLKLVSIANIKGMYYKPRIDKALLKKYSEGLIVSTACLGGEVSRKLMHEGHEAAEKAILWYKDIFKDDFYLEVQRHPAKDARLRKDVTENQNYVNAELIKLGQKHNIKVIATNDVHFVNEKDATAHDLLICLSTGKDLDDPARMRYTQQEWFKSTQEMNELWSDYPEALRNTQEIVKKVEAFELNSNPIMPEFPIPMEFGTIEDYRKKYSEDDLKAEFERYNQFDGFESVLRIKLESDYLAYLTKEGAAKRYGDSPSEDTKSRIDFELNTIKQMGFPGYFLIVQDFIGAARNMGVLVGPGRGSAAGSVVSYCLGITNIDPIKYDLLFERFLNPDRISMPDIDIDFDDDGRQQVLEWVTRKYGNDRVAHICTFGTMAAKMAMKDVARVLRLPLDEAIRLTKEFPENGKLARGYQRIVAMEKELGSLARVVEAIKKERAEAVKQKDGKAEIKADVLLFMCNEIANARDTNNHILIDTLEYACTLEGSVRQTGVHACGILIGKTSLDDNIPLMPTKEEDLLTTQYDGKYVESIGLLKMDFLGLKTLSIIKETLANIKLSKNIDIDIEAIDFSDPLTFELFSRGETTAIFQFESDGMKKYLRELKPNRFEDLVAMNALYRPGPMEYIPDYINRKHGRKEVSYDHPLMEQYLKETNGITVFQEQVMLLSRMLGNFTRGQSDTLRKAMGKKKLKLMAELKVLFVEGCLGNEEFIKGCKDRKSEPTELIDKIWRDWESFASYAFNKSHSVCYAYVAYQTGYLKARYPAEFMAANLSRNLSNITEVSKLMEEAKRMGLKVMVPDVNESFAKFTVNAKGHVRFGMAAVKGLGQAAVEQIIQEREKNGKFKNIVDFIERVSLSTVNKRSIEAMVISGCFDSFDDIERHQFFIEGPDGTNFIDQLVKYGNLVSNQQSTGTLFGNDESYQQAQKVPEIPQGERWPEIVKLNKEKELVGVYLSSHPLDNYRIEMDYFVRNTLDDLNNLEALKGREISVAGLVTEVRHAISNTGRHYGTFTLEDYSSSYKFFLFSREYEEYRKFLYENYTLIITGNVGEKYNREELEFKIKSIKVLDHSLKELIKEVQIKVSVTDITERTIVELKSEAEKHKGKTHLKFTLVDPVEHISLDMFSRNMSVDINNDFLGYLKSRPEFEFKLS